MLNRSKVFNNMMKWKICSYSHSCEESGAQSAISRIPRELFPAIDVTWCNTYINVFLINLE